MNTEDKYISREAVLKTLQKANIGGYITERLLEIPAADVHPVKHGRWKEEEPRELVCSLCGKYAPMNFMHQHCVETAYCPHCGARMDKE